MTKIVEVKGNVADTKGKDNSLQAVKTNSGYVFENYGENQGQSLDDIPKDYFQRPTISTNKVWNLEDTGFAGDETKPFINVHCPIDSLKKSVEALQGKVKESIGAFIIVKELFDKVVGKASLSNGSENIQQDHDSSSFNRVQAPETKNGECSAMAKILNPAAKPRNADVMTENIVKDKELWQIQKISESAENATTQRNGDNIFSHSPSGILTTVPQFLYSLVAAGLSYVINFMKCTSCEVFCDDVSWYRPGRILTAVLQLANSSVYGFSFDCCGSSLISLFFILCLLPFTASSNIQECSGHLGVYPKCPVVTGNSLTIPCKRSNSTARWEAVNGYKTSIIALNGKVFDDNFTVTVTPLWSNITIKEVDDSMLSAQFVCHVGEQCQMSKKISDYVLTSQLKIPANVMVLAISDTMIFVMWEQDNIERCKEKITCRIEYRTEETSSWTSVDVDVSGQVGRLNYTLSSLMPGKVYELRMYAYNEVGSSNCTKSFVAKTASKDDQQNDKTGFIIGVVFGVIGIIIAVVCFCFCCKKKANSSQKVCSCCGNLFNKNRTSKSRGVYSQTAQH